MKLCFLAIIRKEFIHIGKDPLTLLIIFVFPLVMLFLFGYAITLDMSHIPTRVIDLDRTPQSRELIRTIGAGGFFNVTEGYATGAQVEHLFHTKQAQLVLVIPEHYADSLQRNLETPVQALIDASDSNAAILIRNYLTQILDRLNRQVNPDLPVAFEVAPLFLYNPAQEASHFFVPGLVAVILLLISGLLTSSSIAREKETGTLEQLLVSPVTPVEIIMGKVIPYLLIGFLCGLIILFSGVAVFGVPFRGSWPTVFLAMILYIFSGLSLGLLISTIAATQQTALMAVLILTILPAILLSGFVFPIESMAWVFRALSVIIPARHFIEILRAVMLKGVGLTVIYPQMLYLSGLSVLLITVSIRKFKNKLE